jgi:hypothetical protein
MAAVAAAAAAAGNTSGVNINTIEDLFNLLESNKSELAQEVKQLVQEQFKEGTTASGCPRPTSGPTSFQCATHGW